MTTTSAGFPTSRMALVGWDAKGDVDRRFGAMGFRDLGIPSPDGGGSVANGIALGSDDRMVVAGGVAGDGGIVPALVQLAPDGGFDTSFGSGGIRVFSLPPGWLDGALTNVRFSADGAMLAVGSFRTLTDASARFAVGVAGLKANPNDLAIFEDEGGVDSIWPLQAVSSAAASVTVLAGRSDQSLLLLRFVPGTGAPPMMVGLPPSLDVVAIASSVGDDRMLLTFAAGEQFGVARVGADGSLDPTFGDAGAISFGPDASVSGDPSAHPLTRYSPAAALRHSNGFIYVVGLMELKESQTMESPVTTRIALVRLTGNGTVDTSFGQGGLATVPDGAIAGVLQDVSAIAEDACRGRIIVLGRLDGSPAIFAFWP